MNKEKINYLLIGAITLLIILGVWFFWYEIRPSRIQAECSNRATDAITKSIETSSSKLDLKDISELRELNFQMCLNDKGIR